MGEMDRSVWLEPGTAGASLQGCLYADAVMLLPSLGDTAVAAEVVLHKQMQFFFIIHLLF